MAAPTIVLTRNFYPYISDNTDTYTIATLTANAGAQTSPPAPIAPEANPRFPVGWVMRKVHCEYTSGGITYRTVVPIFDPADGIWTGVTTTVSKFSQTYNVVSHIGERRIYRS